ncbi:MAG: SsrA-binding protein SmpB [Deltaproteobacteria bacterium]|nr:SsrA-binding protein SmpB [Deltaproteobacteria bacterium]
MSKNDPGIKLIAQNRQARRLYEILETEEAGMVLTGSEVKSLRAGRVSFKDGYVRFADGEAHLVGVHVGEYENAGYAGHEPERPRKLLMHKRQILVLAAQVEQKGLTVIPLKMYFRNGKIKIEIGLAKGKHVYDRRDELKRRAVSRDMEREMARFK